VELVHAYSNLLPGSASLLRLRVKASSARRQRERRPSRQSQVRLEPHQADALARAYRAGGATKELAARFGIHRGTVTAVLQRLGVEPRKRGLDDEQTAEACRLYAKGWSLARLAERYDVADMTVRRYLLFAGVVMRSPHDRYR
jgi:DNA invertase Pin-like site-specific DNA recombinase